MKKVWTYKRKNLKGWWVGWYENGIRKTKALPTKDLAEHFRQLKYSQLNSDVFTGTLTVTWSQMIQEYTNNKRVHGNQAGSIYEVSLTLRHFERLVGKCISKLISQHTVAQFILKRQKEIKRTTANKDIRNIKAFINWCRQNRYVNGEIKIKLLKEDERPVKSLSEAKIKNMLLLCRPYRTLRMRILLALGTGLRRGDIESLAISDIDFSNNSVTTKSSKTRKSMGSRPVPTLIMAELEKYLAKLDPKQEKVFTDNFSQCRWNRIREVIGEGDLKFHDLRRTFSSVLAQNGISTAVIQKLLEHSSAELTNKIYTNVDPVLRSAVDQLPVDGWL